MTLWQICPAKTGAQFETADSAPRLASHSEKRKPINTFPLRDRFSELGATTAQFAMSLSAPRGGTASCITHQNARFSANERPLRAFSKTPQDSSRSCPAAPQTARTPDIRPLSA